MRRAKIICTLGPASQSQEMIERLVAAGMDVARLNFSHGTHAEAAQVIERLRAATLKVRRPVAILADLQGPEVRTGRIAAGEVTLVAGRELCITTEDGAPGTAELISTTYPHLAEDVNPGDRILLDDGHLELRVKTTDKRARVRTEVVLGGPLRSAKSLNLPGVALRGEALTAKDREDMVFSIKAGVDYVALSFVRSPADLDTARAAMGAAGRQVPIIAKLERPEALERLDAILDKADGVMVGRGDLGVEIPPEDVPAIQRDVIRRANLRGLPVIVATQMLNSMVEHPHPTRAEASDVASAVFDGADALMLSSETAQGQYPIDSVQMMERVIHAAEASLRQQPRPLPPEPARLPAPYPEVICGLACRAAREAGAVLIAAFTLTGTTARLLSRYRPQVPIIAFSPNQEVRRRLGLLWGVVPRVFEPMTEPEGMVGRVEEELISRGLATRGDRVVIVFGAPVGAPGKINSLRLHTLAG